MGLGRFYAFLIRTKGKVESALPFWRRPAQLGGCSSIVELDMNRI
jgi:hypothetical protein